MYVYTSYAEKNEIGSAFKPRSGSGSANAQRIYQNSSLYI